VEREVVKKILICDDSPAEVRLLQSVLETAGYWPVAIQDPNSIERTIEIERPALILLDVVMPGRNGFQICRDLKNHAEFGRIPVVMVSSKDGESDKFWAKQQGADGYVVKPFTAAALLAEVGRLA
jgi:twitching motility two-component system response regulator PilH